MQEIRNTQLKQALNQHLIGALLTCPLASESELEFLNTIKTKNLNEIQEKQVEELFEKYAGVHE